MNVSRKEKMKKTVLLFALVLAVFALMVFKPNVINADAPKQYKIVSVRSSDDKPSETLMNMVMAELNNGWSLQGGPFTFSDGYTKFGQALVK
jgi:hypothetical protein